MQLFLCTSEFFHNIIILSNVLNYEVTDDYGESNLDEIATTE